MKIIIPSYKRPNEVLGLHEVNPEIQKKYYQLAVRKSEELEYKKNYPHPEYLILPDDVDGIRGTRQWINENSTGKIMVIDDDVVFRRTFPKPCLSCKEKGKPQVNWARYTKEDTNEVIEDMVEYLDGLMDEYPYGSLRSLNTHARVYEDVIPYQLNKPGIWSCFFNLDKFDTQKYNYHNATYFIQDIWMSIVYFHSGKDFPSVTKFGVHGMKGMTGQDGGCGIGPERVRRHNKSAMELQEMFPQYVEVIQSKTFDMLSVKTKLNTKYRNLNKLF